MTRIVNEYALLTRGVINTPNSKMDHEKREHVYYCGIHGDNRLGANALTDILVIGRIAGESAVRGR